MKEEVVVYIHIRATWQPVLLPVLLLQPVVLPGIACGAAWCCLDVVLPLTVRLVQEQCGGSSRK
jgi:hypothetical protein